MLDKQQLTTINEAKTENFLLKHTAGSTLEIGKFQATFGLHERTSFFEKDLIENGAPVLFILSGSAESGKSHMGLFFKEKGYGHRLKFLNAIGEVFGEDIKPSERLKSTQKDKERTEIVEAVSSKFLSIMEETGVRVGVVETIKHPWVVEAFKELKGVRVLTMYIDAPMDLRVAREFMKKGGEKKTNEIWEQICLKDGERISLGSDNIPNVADIVINNAGSLEAYEHFLEALNELADPSRLSLNGRTVEYS